LLNRMTVPQIKIPSEFKIPTIYVVLGALWILFSGKALHAFVQDPQVVFQFEIYKGWFYVAITGSLLYILIRKDTQRRNKVLQELKLAKSKAEESDRLKSAFLANLSHYLRTPMNSILGFVDLLKDRNLDEKKREKFLSIINEQSNYLLQFIGNIIEISKLQEGQLTVTRQEFSLNGMIKKIRSRYQTEIDYHQKSSHLTLTAEIPDNDNILNSDAKKLEYVFTNLLSNALKFTKSGEIKFGYTLKNNSVEFFVSDTGCGIHPTKQPLITQTFMLSDPDILEENIGIGLGLAITEGLVKLLDGKLWLAYSTPAGTKFCFTIPFD
jgi:signal transduction histidine kinase